MSKKVVLELYMYTDGDWRYDASMFEDYTSEYFDNDLYEYTFIEDYTTKIRRTFNLDEEDWGKEIIGIFDSICDSLHGRQSAIECVSEFFHEVISHFPRIDTDHWFHDWYESNTEIEVKIMMVENEARKIKEIIYE